MTTEEAIEIVARHVAAAMVEDAYDNWDRYPEIGEADWVAVVDRIVDQLVEFPPVEEYDKAYQILTDRADNDA
jgi:hypothetical protein